MHSLWEVVAPATGQVLPLLYPILYKEGVLVERIHTKRLVKFLIKTGASQSLMARQSRGQCPKRCLSNMLHADAFSMSTSYQ